MAHQKPFIMVKSDGHRRQKSLVLFFSILLLIVAVLFLVEPAAADDTGEDPLGLLIGYDVTSHYSLGEDLWEVWICEAPDGDLDLSASEVAKLMESELVPYFDWLSGGRYRPVFRVGVPGKVAAPGFGRCLESVAAMSKAGTEGVVALVNQETDFAQGNPGPWYWIETENSGRIELMATSYPNNERSVIGGGDLVAVPPDQTKGTKPPLISILAHELGHTLWFPHSYRFDPSEYDNPMDIMSDAEAAPGLQIGTIAFNRYTAGWIDQEEVEVYSGNGKSRYTMAPPGIPGTQMLVIQSGDDGFITLGARVRKGYDSGLPKEGVESYFIDTETLNCGGTPLLLPCFGLERSIQAVSTNLTVPLDFFDSVGHVMDVDDGYNYGDISVRLVERRGDKFVIEVADVPLKVKATSDDDRPSTIRNDWLETDVPIFSEEVYDADPLGLIAGYDSSTAYTLDDDLWEVWICNAPDGYLDINPEDAVGILQSRVVPYFKQLSGGRYRPTFRVGGSVEISLEDDPGGGNPGYGNCGEIVDKAVGKRASTPSLEGVMRIINKRTFESDGGLGDKDRQGSVLALHDLTFPENNRDINLWGTVVATPSTVDLDNLDTVPDYFLPYLADDQLQDLRTVAHEMGHALGFPHSKQFFEYDNPMDIMSHVDDIKNLQVGTIAINRYAAGWIDTSEVAVYSGKGTRRYILKPLGDGGIQMLVIRSKGSGYLTLGVRVKKGIDSLIPKEGVETYFIDQESPGCRGFGGCVWTGRPTRAVTINPTIPLDFDDRLAHVMDEGDGFITWNNISVTIVERIGDDFVVEVTDGQASGGSVPEKGNRFTDDDGNVHEGNIETIAALGITVGCGNPDDNLYCPSRTVTRAQMAAFLIRALGETPETASRVSRFSDVPQDAWYLGYVERLAYLNIVRADTDSAFRPSDPLTRLEMAVWMTRAFDSVRESTPQGVFDDIPDGARYAGAVEGLRAAGITRGCSAGPPPTYCPDAPVRRDQMASFLGRALAARGS